MLLFCLGLLLLDDGWGSDVAVDVVLTCQSFVYPFHLVSLKSSGFGTHCLWQIFTVALKWSLFWGVRSVLLVEIFPSIAGGFVVIYGGRCGMRFYDNAV